MRPPRAAVVVCGVCARTDGRGSVQDLFGCCCCCIATAPGAGRRRQQVRESPRRQHGAGSRGVPFWPSRGRDRVARRPLPRRMAGADAHTSCQTPARATLGGAGRPAVSRVRRALACGCLQAARALGAAARVCALLPGRGRCGPRGGRRVRSPWRVGGAVGPDGSARSGGHVALLMRLRRPRPVIAVLRPGVALTRGVAQRTRSAAGEQGQAGTQCPNGGCSAGRAAL